LSIFKAGLEVLGTLL